VGIFHSGDFAEYVSGGFVHFSSGDDRCEAIVTGEHESASERHQ